MDEKGAKDALRDLEARQKRQDDLEDRVNRATEAIAEVKPPEVETFGTFSVAEAQGRLDRNIQRVQLQQLEQQRKIVRNGEEQLEAIRNINMTARAG